ncbi:MAG: ADP-ribosylglycohydrolase family protein [Methanocorpusculum sp.]|nr:ADP-ribosylglycohydrolase family protein [Methanocorpusculum sp.]
MLDTYRGCLIGAVLGDALGMPNETSTARFTGELTFKKAYRGHPNFELSPGQYTDDSQIILIASRLLAEGTFNKENYAKELHKTFTLNKFRYPDGATYAACKKMDASKKFTESGVMSDSAGCMALAVPFALCYSDRKAMAKDLLEACCVTHTHAAAHAAVIGFALYLNTIIETRDIEKAYSSLMTAMENMDAELGRRIENAMRIESQGVPLDVAVNIIGSTSSVYHTLPLAMYLTKRYFVPCELLSAASSCGGNCDTVAMLCGAVCGARFGMSSLPEELIRNLERAGIFAELAEKLMEKAHSKNAEK